jgi:hypothetical protein
MKTNKMKSGFTLVEALFAAMLLGLVIAALAAASGAFTMANGYGVDLSTSEFLIEEMRELTANETFADLLANYDGQTFNPPKDLSNSDMTDFSEFSQQVDIDYVQADNLDQDSAVATDFVRVTVTITKSGTPVCSTSWIRANI